MVRGEEGLEINPSWTRRCAGEASGTPPA